MRTETVLVVNGNIFVIVSAERERDCIEEKAKEKKGWSDRGQKTRWNS